MGFSRQGYWSGLPCPSPGDLPDPGTEPRSPGLQADCLPSEPAGSPSMCHQFSSVQLSHSVLSDSLQPHRLQHTRLPCPSPSPQTLRFLSIELVTPSNHLIPFSSCLQSFPASGSFPMNQFSSGGQSIGASASVLPVNIQD